MATATPAVTTLCTCNAELFAHAWRPTCAYPMDGRVIDVDAALHTASAGNNNSNSNSSSTGGASRTPRSRLRTDSLVAASPHGGVAGALMRRASTHSAASALGRVCPSRCVVFGPALVKVLAGTPSYVTVLACDANGTPLREGGERWTAALVRVDVSRSVAPLDDPALATPLHVAIPTPPSAARASSRVRIDETPRFAASVAAQMPSLAVLPESASARPHAPHALNASSSASDSDSDDDDDDVDVDDDDAHNRSLASLSSRHRRGGPSGVAVAPSPFSTPMSSGSALPAVRTPIGLGLGRASAPGTPSTPMSRAASVLSPSSPVASSASRPSSAAAMRGGTPTAEWVTPAARAAAQMLPPGAEPLDVQDRQDGSYQVRMTVPRAGRYALHILRGREHVADSPYAIPVQPDRCEPRQCTLDNYSPVCSAGDEYVLRVQANDACGNPVGDSQYCYVELVGGPQNRTLRVETTATGGLHTARATLSEAGSYAVRAYVNGTMLACCPAPLSVHAGETSPAHCTMLGAGAMSCVPRTVARLTIVARDAHGNETHDPGLRFFVRIRQQRVVPVPYELIDNGDGTYSLTYRPANDWPLSLQIRLDGQDIRGSPASITVMQQATPIVQPAFVPLGAVAGAKKAGGKKKGKKKGGKKKKK